MSNSNVTQILYELALSIGTSLDLEEMATHALRTYIRKLNCSAGAIFRSEGGDVSAQRLPVAVIPKQIQRQKRFHDQLDQVIEQCGKDQNFQPHTTTLVIRDIQDEPHSRMILGALPQFGFMVLKFSHDDFDDYLFHSIARLNQRLLEACQACLQNQAVEKSRTRYRNIFTSIQDVYIQVHAETGAILEISPSVKDMLGYTREEVLGTPIASYSATEADFIDLHRRLKGKVHVNDAKTIIQDKSGNRHIGSLTLRLDTELIPGVPVLAGILRDVTEGQELQKALEYRLDFETLISRISSDFLATDLQDLDRVINAALESISRHIDVDRAYVFMFQEETQVMSNSHEYCAPGVTPEIENLQNLPTEIFPWWMEHLRKRQPVVIPSVKDLPPEASAEKEILEPQGILSLLVLPIHTGERLFGFVGFDATSHAKAWGETERSLLQFIAGIMASALSRQQDYLALNESERRLRAVLNAMPVGVLLSSREDHQIQLINPAGAAMVGDNPDALMGISTGSLFPDLHGEADDSRDTQTADTVTVTDTTLHRPDGLKVPVLLTSVDVEFKDQRFRMESFVDISQQKAGEEALKSNLQAKNDFVSNVSHELRTPLASILGFSGTILRDASMPVEVQQEFIQIIYDESQRLTRLIENVLDLSRMEAGRLHLSMRALSPLELFEEVMETMAILADKKSLQIEKEVDEALPNIIGDGDAFTQMLTNLIGNAIKFTEPQGRVSLKLKAEAHDMILEVEDSGIGIPESELPHIFEKFYRVHHPQREDPGTGIGLAIVKEIVEQHEGQIEVESTLGEGTRFRVRIPLAQTHPLEPEQN